MRPALTYSFLCLFGSIITPTSADQPASIEKRSNANDVISDIRNIDTFVKRLNSDVSGYQGGGFLTGFIESTPVLLDTVSVHLATRKGYADALSSANFSTPESQSIIQTVAGTVLSSIPTAIDSLKMKKPNFQQAGLTPAVTASEKLLLSDFDTFSGVVLRKLTLDSAGMALAKSGIAVIHNAIQSGITYYES